MRQGTDHNRHYPVKKEEGKNKAFIAENRNRSENSPVAEIGDRRTTTLTDEKKRLQDRRNRLFLSIFNHYNDALSTLI